MQLKDVATKAILYGSIDLGAGKKSYSDYDLNDYKENGPWRLLFLCLVT